MAAGSIIVDLLLRSGSFSTDTARAARSLQAFEKAAMQVGKTIGLAFGAAAVASVVIFDKLVKGAADFQDMAEMTGASAEAMASYSVAAATAGVGMESVSSAMIKLTKGLTGVDDESKAAGAALGALGLNVAAFKKLDPSAQYEAVGKALGGFADGAGKTAIALALFGKAGAEQLKVFKALEEQGGRSIILTAEQIKQADAYSDAQAKLKAEILLTAQAIATSALPALTEMANALREAGKDLDLAGAAAWTFHSALDGITVLFQTVAVVAANVAFVFGGVGREIGAIGAQLVALAHGDLTGFRAISDAVKEDGARARAELDKFEARVMGIGKAKYADPRILGPVGSIAEQTAANRPRLSFEGPADKAKKAPGLSEAQKYLETLQKQVEAVADLSNYEKVLAEIQSGRLTGMTPKIKEQALAYGATLDGVKALDEAMAKSIATTREWLAEQEQAAKAQENKTLAISQELASVVQSNDAIRRSIELAGIEGEAKAALESVYIGQRIAEEEVTLAVMNQNAATEKQIALQQELIGALKDQQGLTTQKAAVDTFVEEQKKMEDAAKSLRGTIENTLGQGLEDAMNGNFKNIGRSFQQLIQRMIADAAAAQIMKSLFGSSSGGSGLSGLAGLFASLFGSSGYGSVSGGTGVAGAVGNNPSAYTPMAGGGVVPYDGFRASLHAGERVVPKGQALGTTVIVENHGAEVETQQAKGPGGEEITKLIVRMKREVAADIRGGGGDVAAAMKSRGVNLSGGLPRRG